MSSFVINPYRFAAASAFVPTNISGCLLWYDMSDATTMYTDQGSTLVSADGDLVRRIDDKSGNSRYAESAADASRMTYTTNAQNGLSVLDAIDTTNQYRVEAQSWFSLNSVTAFLVAKANALDGTFRLFWASRANVVNGDRFYIGATSTNFSATVDTSGGINTASDTTDYHIHTLRHGSNTAEYFVDGVSAGTLSRTSTATPYWSGFGYLIPGGGTGGVNQIDANFCEIIFYDTALSASDRGDVETYLADKWDITI